MSKETGAASVTVDGNGATGGASFLNVAVITNMINLNVEDYVLRGILDLT